QGDHRCAHHHRLGELVLGDVVGEPFVVAVVDPVLGPFVDEGVRARSQLLVGHARQSRPRPRPRSVPPPSGPRTPGPRSPPPARPAGRTPTRTRGTPPRPDHRRAAAPRPAASTGSRTPPPGR